jgi:membrane protein DedA with SNARE-associated domain
LETFVINLLTHTKGIPAYLLIYVVLVACGLGIPLPEDISLVMGGFLSHLGVTSLPVMMAVGFLGILTGDSLIYSAGRRMGLLSQGTGFFARVVTPEKRAKVERLFAVHGQKIVMVARFLPGIRAVTYFTAGSAGMSYWRFIFWDGLAALVSAPLFVYLGSHFGGHLRYLKHRIHQGQAIGLVVLAAGVALYLFYRHYPRRTDPRAARTDSHPPSRSSATPSSTLQSASQKEDSESKKAALGSSSQRPRVSAHSAE